MNLRFFLQTMCVIFLSLPFIASSKALDGGSTPNLTLDQVVEKYLEQIGDIKKVQTRKVQMRMIGLAPFEIKTSVEAKRSNRMRQEVDIQGTIQISAYDGQDAWKVDPFLPSGKRAFDMPKADLTAFVEESYFDGLLVTAKELKFPMRLLGVEKVGDKTAYAIQIEAKTGTTTIFLDTTSFLEIKRLQHRMVMGKSTELEVIVSDYRKQDGLQMPFKFEIGGKESKQKMQVLVEQITLNVPIDNNRF